MGRWKMVRLGEISSLITKGTTPTTLGYSFQDSGINFVKIESLTETGEFIPNKFQFISEECNQKLKRSMLEKNDILFSIAGALGRVAIVTDEILPANTNQALAIIRISCTKVYLKYATYALKSNYVFEQFQKQKQGVAQLNLSLRNIGDIEIPLPPLDIQQKIADILDISSAALEKRRAQIDKLDLLIKSQFIEMFGDPVTNPKGWELKELKESATLLNGRAYSQEELLNSGKYPVLRVGNFFSNQNWYYSDLELDENKYCNAGDLLFAWSASFGAKIWVGGKTIYHYHIWKIVYGEKYNKIFLCHLLNYATKNLMNNTHGIAMMHLTKSGMEQTKFVVPPIGLQNQFASFVQQVEAQKSLLQESLDKLELNHKSLMQKAFRGELFKIWGDYYAHQF